MECYLNFVIHLFLELADSPSLFMESPRDVFSIIDKIIVRLEHVKYVTDNQFEPFYFEQLCVEVRFGTTK